MAKPRTASQELQGLVRRRCFVLREQAAMGERLLDKGRVLEDIAHSRFDNCARSFVEAHGVGGGVRSKTKRPPTIVRSTGVVRIFFGSILKRSSANMTRSASMPG